MLICAHLCATKGMGMGAGLETRRHSEMSNCLANISRFANVGVWAIVGYGQGVQVCRNVRVGECAELGSRGSGEKRGKGGGGAVEQTTWHRFCFEFEVTKSPRESIVVQAEIKES